MKIKKNVDVYTIDGKKSGEIERVVINPADFEISHIVIEKGFLFKDHKVVPMDLVGTATEERVNLRLKEEQLDELPNLNETEFVKGELLEENQEGFTQAPFPMYWYPPAGTVWWAHRGFAASGLPFFVLRTEQQIPEGTVALEEGAKVVSRDEKHIGSIEEVLTDPESNRATNLIISKGLFLKERKMVPTFWIKKVEEDEVHLAIGSELFESIPDYDMED